MSSRRSSTARCLSTASRRSWHPTYGYGLLTNGYTLTGPVKGADGEYTCTVTLLASAYLAEYNGRRRRKARPR